MIQNSLLGFDIHSNRNTDDEYFDETPSVQRQGDRSKSIPPLDQQKAQTHPKLGRHKSPEPQRMHKKSSYPQRKLNYDDDEYFNDEYQIIEEDEYPRSRTDREYSRYAPKFKPVVQDDGDPKAKKLREEADVLKHMGKDRENHFKHMYGKEQYEKDFKIYQDYKPISLISDIGLKKGEKEDKKTTPDKKSIKKKYTFTHKGSKKNFKKSPYAQKQKNGEHHSLTSSLARQENTERTRVMVATENLGIQTELAFDARECINVNEKPNSSGKTIGIGTDFPLPVQPPPKKQGKTHETQTSIDFKKKKIPMESKSIGAMSPPIERSVMQTQTSHKEIHPLPMSIQKSEMNTQTSIIKEEEKKHSIPAAVEEKDIRPAASPQFGKREPPQAEEQKKKIINTPQKKQTQNPGEANDKKNEIMDMFKTNILKMNKTQEFLKKMKEITKKETIKEFERTTTYKKIMTKKYTLLLPLNKVCHKV
jgi:hypothetical protein